MSPCPICGNPADKTNSHLIPWFLIKNVVTHRGRGFRDTEVSFTISGADFTKVFTGRSVLPETIDELGDMDQLEKEDANPYTRNNLWCKFCEEKFSRLEALFAITFSGNKLKDLTTVPLKNNGHALLIDEQFDYSIYQLFIQSIFWRCSVGKFDKFSLRPLIEKSIQENLKNCFEKSDFSKLKGQHKLEIKHRFPLITAVLYEEELDSTSRFIQINKVHNPYFVNAGRWLFQLYEKEKDVRTTIEWLYGVRNGIDSPKLFKDVKEKSHLLLINKSISEKFSQYQLKNLVDHKIRGLRKNIRMFYMKFFGKRPNESIINYIQGRFFFYYNQRLSEFECFAKAFFDLQ
jgi:hypothetical protein